MTKLDTLFMTKRAEKPFGAAHTYIAYIREYPLPPPPGRKLTIFTSKFAISFSCTFLGMSVL